MSTFICHLSAGSSFKQFLHYAQEIELGFFGNFTNGREISRDFKLSQITAPLSLHYSTNDLLATIEDVEILIPKLKNSRRYIQRISKPEINHIDFVWAKSSASLIYSLILQFFANN